MYNFLSKCFGKFINYIPYICWENDRKEYFLQMANFGAFTNINIHESLITVPHPCLYHKFLISPNLQYFALQNFHFIQYLGWGLLKRITIKGSHFRAHCGNCILWAANQSCILPLLLFVVGTAWSLLLWWASYSKTPNLLLQSIHLYLLHAVCYLFLLTPSMSSRVHHVNLTNVYTTGLFLLKCLILLRNWCLCWMVDHKRSTCHLHFCI